VDFHKRVHFSRQLGLDDGCETEVECPACDKPYQVECSVTVKYNTSPTGGWPDSKT
jgi:hypothetical protein